MKTPEQWAKDAFGFSYIDDVEPQTKTAFGTTGLLNQIKAIQDDAIKSTRASEPQYNESAEMVMQEGWEAFRIASRELAEKQAGRYKEDHRPPRGGWADGHYLRKCFQCQESFIGDKRAVSCADCAYADCKADEIPRVNPVA